MVLRNQNLDARYANCYWGVVPPRPSHWAELGHTCPYVHARARTHPVLVSVFCRHQWVHRSPSNSSKLISVLFPFHIMWLLSLTVRNLIDTGFRTELFRKEGKKGGSYYNIFNMYRCKTSYKFLKLRIL